MKLDTSKTGKLNEQVLLDVTVTFLSYQYLNRLKEKYTLVSMSLNLVIPPTTRERRSLAIIETTFEGVALFRSFPIPPEEELLQLTEDSFKGISNKGAGEYIDLLRNTKDPILMTLQSISVEVAHGNGVIMISDSSENSMSPSLTGGRMSMIPFVAGAVSSVMFLFAVILIAKRSERITQKNCTCDDMMIQESETMEELEISDPFPPELIYANQSSNRDDINSFTSQSYAYSFTYPRSEGRGIPMSGTSNTSNDDDAFSAAVSSFTNLSMEDSQFTPQVSNDPESKDIVSIKERKYAQTPGFSVKWSHQQAKARMDDISDLGSDNELSTSTFTRSIISTNLIT